MSSDEIENNIIKGIIFYSEDKIKELVRKFQEREIAFIQKRETIDLVKEQIKSGEWNLLSKYIRKNELKILVQMGLTLRRLEDKKDFNSLQDLRDKIVYKFGEDGLHISQFVQNKILTEFLASYISNQRNLEDLIRNIEKILNNLEKQVIFIKADDNVDKILEKLNIKLNANEPDSFIIFAKESAIKNAEKINLRLQKIKDFNYKIEIKQEKRQLLILMFKIKSID
ncbi:hypothetical protein J4223_00570 [Candidatus Woesearchaeota archaeon]|nr:hypothetical protein [Candidatus Woesearchaeota archaeon]